MRVCLLSLAALSACAAPLKEPGGEVAAKEAIAEAMRPAPEPQWVLLPPLRPRLDSEIGRMQAAELARWILPAEAHRIVSAELHRGRMPRIGALSLLAAPAPTRLPGLCELRGWEAVFRVPDENALTYRQHLDPPLQPYQYRPMVRWKAAPAADCAGAAGGAGWFEAPSAEAAYRALSQIGQAQARPASVRIACTRWRHDEVLGNTVFPRCADPARLLKRLTPGLVKRVRPADCTSETGASPAGCLGVEYDDPDNPGSHSFYAVTLPAKPPLRAIRIAQGMMPPH